VLVDNENNYLKTCKCSSIYNCPQAVILVFVSQSCSSCVDPCRAAQSAIALMAGRIRSPAGCSTEHRY
jgi:hypothetical protein